MANKDELITFLWREKKSIKVKAIDLNAVFKSMLINLQEKRVDKQIEDIEEFVDLKRKKTVKIVDVCVRCKMFWVKVGKIKIKIRFNEFKPNEHDFPIEKWQFID